VSVRTKIRIIQIIAWVICSAVIIIVIAACSPAHAGCHIVFGQLWCDPDLSRIIPNVRVGITVAPRVAVPPPAAGRPIVTAAYLVEACVSSVPTRQAGCAGFISGVADAHAASGLYCLPADHFAAERAVIEYIRRVPMQGLSATDMVIEALRANFPCR
jgi:hypothetical protein